MMIASCSTWVDRLVDRLGRERSIVVCRVVGMVGQARLLGEEPGLDMGKVVVVACIPIRVAGSERWLVEVLAEEEQA